MNGKNIKIFKFKGVPVEIGLWSLLLVGLSMLLASLTFVTGSRGLSGSTVICLGLLGSIFIHEMAHAIVGMRLGWKVVSIRLGIFDGATYFAEKPPAYLKDVAVCMAGPASNFALWGLFQSLGSSSWFKTTLPGLVWPVALLATLNLLMALFNALPAYPLDGGRSAFALVMVLTSRQKFAAGVVLFSSLIIAGYLIFVSLSVFEGEIFFVVLLWWTALEIGINALPLYKQASSFARFYPSAEQQHQQFQLEGRKWDSTHRPERLFERGQSEFEACRYELALGSFTQAIELKPDEPTYLEHRARTYVRLEEYNQALQDYHQLLKKVPQRADAYAARARLYRLLGMLPEARADLERALQLNPQHGKALSLRAELSQPVALG